MKAPLNRKVFVIGYGAATALGATFEKTYQRAVQGEAGFRRVTKCEVNSLSNIVGEIPDWDPEAYDYFNRREVYNWNAAFVLLTVAICNDALAHSGLIIDADTGPRTACLVGSALNGSDAFRIASDNLLKRGPLRSVPICCPIYAPTFHRARPA